jgi:hypothetical protein
VVPLQSLIPLTFLTEAGLAGKLSISRFPGNSGALRWLSLVLTVVLVQVAATIVAQAATEAGNLQRRYTDGTVSHYLMTGNNDLAVHHSGY